MKLGVLTFHSQLNYGGVLQCWALVRALRCLGHKVVVIDRWLDPVNKKLVGPYGLANFRTWLGIAKGSVVCQSMRQWLVRHARTIKFVRDIGLTPYHFYQWRTAPEDLGVDVVVVGSDQVWHGGDWGEPGVYLLEGAPKIKAIAYAASFGMPSLPDGIDYAQGFHRFAAIGVREKEGVELVRAQGFAATHVVDPTLLLSRDQWSNIGVWKKIKNRLVCYFLSQSIEESLPLLCDWAVKMHATVEILTDEFHNIKPRSWRVRICGGYGPKEFVRAFAQAEMCMADSFHAVMFSSIYGCNLRFIKPETDMRRLMFARIGEFVDACTEGDVIVGSVLEALGSFSSGSKMVFRRAIIDTMRENSKKWLLKALS